MTMSWFVVYAPGGIEFRVVKALKDDQIHGFDAYCPARTMWTKSRKDARVKVALFPGYLFVGMERDRCGDWPTPAVMSVEGVVDVLGTDTRPIPVPYAARAVEGDQPPPFSIAHLIEQENAGAFDLTRDGAKTHAGRRRIALVTKQFSELAILLQNAEAA